MQCGCVRSLLFVVLVLCASWASCDELLSDLERTESGFDAVGNKTLSGCEKKIGCSNCTDSTTCVWCESSNQCFDGNFWGPDGKVFSGCDDWRWEQCKVNGKIVFWGSGAGAALLVLLAFMFVCLCCCRRRSRKWEVEGTERIEKMELDLEAKRINRDTQKKREAFMAKYGRQDKASERERFIK